MASLSIGHQEIPLGVDCTFRVQVSFRLRGGVKRLLSKVSLLNLDAISREGLSVVPRASDSWTFPPRC